MTLVSKLLSVIFAERIDLVAMLVTPHPAPKSTAVETSRRSGALGQHRSQERYTWLCKQRDLKQIQFLDSAGLSVHWKAAEKPIGYSGGYKD